MAQTIGAVLQSGYCLHYVPISLVLNMNFTIILLFYCFFSQVLLARHKTEEKVFAVKVLQKQAICKRNEVKHIMSERNVLLKNVQHPFLVGLHYSFQTPDKLYFVLDYVNGGEVSNIFVS